MKNESLSHACRYCSSFDVVPVSWYNHLLGLPNDASGIHLCHACALMQRFIFPDPVDCPPRKKYVGSTAGTAQANRRMLKRLRLLEAAYGKGSLLDVGTGAGTFVEAASRLGWRATGIELPGTTVQRSNIVTVDITKEPIPDIEPGSIHVVHIHHVLEHVEHIRQFLTACIAYLSPDGTLVLEVPNEVKSLAIVMKRLLGRAYDSRTAYLDHRYFFTKPVLCRILRDAGLNILMLRTPFTCYETSLVHQAFDGIQSIARMGNCIEVHCRKER